VPSVDGNTNARTFVRNCGDRSLTITPHELRAGRGNLDKTVSGISA
jgi:hypothetical protein